MRGRLTGTLPPALHALRCARSYDPYPSYVPVFTGAECDVVAAMWGTPMDVHLANAVQQPAEWRRGAPAAREVMRRAQASASADAPSSVADLQPDFSMLSVPGAQAGAQAGAAHSDATTEARDPPGGTAWDSRGARILCVGQVKRGSKLVAADGSPLPLVALVQQRDGSTQANTAVYIVSQLFTHIVLAGCEFGWLSSYDYTWLAWWVCLADSS